MHLLRGPGASRAESMKNALIDIEAVAKLGEYGRAKSLRLVGEIPQPPAPFEPSKQHQILAETMRSGLGITRHEGFKLRANSAKEVQTEQSPDSAFSTGRFVCREATVPQFDGPDGAGELLQEYLNSTSRKVAVMWQKAADSDVLKFSLDVEKLAKQDDIASDSPQANDARQALTAERGSLQPLHHRGSPFPPPRSRVTPSPVPHAPQTAINTRLTRLHESREEERRERAQSERPGSPLHAFSRVRSGSLRPATPIPGPSDADMEARPTSPPSPTHSMDMGEGDRFHPRNMVAATSGNRPQAGPSRAAPDAIRQRTGGGKRSRHGQSDSASTTRSGEHSERQRHDSKRRRQGVGSPTGDDDLEYDDEDT